MNNYHPPNPDDDTAEFVTEAKIMFRRSATVLAKAINAIEEAAPPDAKSAGGSAKDMRQALGWIMDENKNVEKIEKSIAAANGIAGYDLDAARSEIGGRLARLRAARGDGGVSGELK